MVPIVIPDESYPFSLRDLCLFYCVRNTHTFSTFDPVSKNYNLKHGVSLPPEICESLVQAYEGLGKTLDDNFMHIFKDHTHTHLRQVNVQDSDVTGTALKWLIAHKPAELNISGCDGITNETLQCINEYGKLLTKLFIGSSLSIFENVEIKERSSGEHQPSAQGDGIDRVLGRDYIFDCPEVRAFSVHNLDSTECPAHDIIATSLHPFNKLTYLDLSNCHINVESMESWDNLYGLTSLILYNVPLHDIHTAFQKIGALKNLRSLDLSQSDSEKSDPVMYSNPEENLAYLVSNLPELVNLDLSGTNLSGFPKVEEVSHQLQAAKIDGEEDEKKPCAIPGLEGRHFEFLGLLNCAHEASHRKGIPADKVAGELTAGQVICASQTYLEKQSLLLKALHFLSEVFKHLFNYDKAGALLAVLNAMRRYPKSDIVQLAASASLFYLMKEESDRRTLRNVQIREILHALFDAMENHPDVHGVRRNCVMTLMNMDFPSDVRKDFRRLVAVMLKMIEKFEETDDDSLEMRSFHLLNMAAVEVDLNEKEVFGNLRGITMMLGIIKKRLGIDKPDQYGYFTDDRIQEAWTVLWNYSDETPLNCERFLDAGGMDVFLECYQTFPNRYGLMRNMMGLTGNVAEVKYLRPRLLKKEYIEVFTKMLSADTRDGIELNYHACGALAHIMSDGPDAWKIEEPDRVTVRRAMLRALNKWSVAARRQINYRSFKPLLRLVPLTETSIAQHWAVWALRNLIGEYRHKYCGLLHKEGGLTLLHRVVNDPNATDRVKVLATKTLEICRYYFDDDNLGTEQEVNPPPLPF